MQEPFLKDSTSGYIFEFPNSKVGANLMVMQLAKTAHNCLYITAHHPDNDLLMNHPLAPAISSLANYKSIGYLT